MNGPDFEGVLAYVDTPSDCSPYGARGHKVLLTRQAFENARTSLLRAPLRSQHPKRVGRFARQFRCGLIEDAQIHGDAIKVRGRMRVGARVPQGDCQLSYELKNAHVADIRADVWVITACEFTGVALIPDCNAAYRRSSFRVVERGIHGR